MYTKNKAILVLVVSLVISGCGPGQILGPTLTPLPTITPTQTATPIPTQTSTPVPTLSTYIPVPRWMILGQPAYGVEILGEKWSYTNDHWGETYACIDYTREKEPYLFFEQCFAWTLPDLTFESERDKILSADFEVLKPNNTFGDVGQISLMAKRLEDNSTKFVKFLEIVGVEKYILLVEMNLATDDQTQLQAIYENQAANIINYVLQNGLEKSRLTPRPTATSLSPTQESFYAPLAENLITESEASTLYEGTWEALGDYVDPKDPYVCRDFEDRTNADVLWVRFSNCIFLYDASTFNFEEFVEGFKQPDNVFLESGHQYDDKFSVFGNFDGHTYFHALMLHGEYWYYVKLESRTLGGQKVDDVFTADVDDFIYGVLMTNAQR